MKLPRDLSGRHLVQALCRDWRYRLVHQVGSHIVIETDTPQHQRLSVPDHHPLRLGTLGAILRAVAAHKNVRREEILASL
ncbi:MAG: type II toxin-antitoxin system HicA family toxin [Gammaproteobacteria bacterium]|nr:type II toxin-antitoxin system HicA family toxin [Gammaproteobacteria bacterium]